MGLDVTVYIGLTKVDAPTLDGDGYPENDNERKFYDNSDFPGRIDGVDAGAVYRYEDADDVFSGGYGRYSGWREQLAKVAGYQAIKSTDRFRGDEPRHDEGAFAAEGGPFYELINFSDCEGTIGPIVAAKLAKDFAEFQAKADAHESEYFRDTYADWRKGCEQAAQNGALDFH